MSRTPGSLVKSAVPHWAWLARAQRRSREGLAPDPARRRCVRALAALLLAPAHGARAQVEAEATEYQIKAAFLYKFIAYVEWPQGTNPWPEGSLVIGVIGSNPLADELAGIVEHKNAPGRQVMVRRLQPRQSTDGLHVLFIGKDANPVAEEVLNVTRTKPVLTVTESEAAFAMGSVINFVVVADKIRFDVALQRAELNSIKISSRLLAVARKVL